MASWRDTASPRAQQELDELLNVALGFAQQELAVHGEFFPYAAAIRADGQPELIGSRPIGEGDRPASGDVIAACVATLADRRDDLHASAIVADVSTPEGDAIRVDLEHREGHAMTILLPYSLGHPGGNVDYGALRLQAGRQQVWA